ncbi:MAG: MBOAT family protein, partial [Lachnospiraceae bacterium]|nr:MBOAT family protein [Lachnospiraceae bacterium]
FRDYLFYPLTLSAPLKKLTSAARKRLGNIYGPLCTGAIALFCVWMCNGLWHGAAWSFIFFGFYHFVMIAGGSLIQPLGRKLREALSIREDAGPLRLLQILRTGILVVIGELFFRAEGLRAGFSMLGRMLTHFSFRGLDGAMLGQLGLDMADVGIVLVTMLLILVMGLLQERGLPIRASLQKKPAALRWALLYGLILYIVLFGAYGTGYLPVDPMYANF